MPSRREFLSLAGAAVASSLPAADPQPPGKLLVRRDIYGLDVNGPEIKSLRKAVAVMKAKPKDDPTSWVYQANIHGTYDTPLKRAWATCQHGNYWFAPWHRMYCYWFERILRASAEDPTLTLPYWNYGPPSQRKLPLALREPTDPEKNSLYEPKRNTEWGGINNGAEIPGSAVVMFRPFAFTNYYSSKGQQDSFGGQTIPSPVHYDDPHGAFESWHDILHVICGGETGYFSDPNLAALDMGFWLHHCNVDRLLKRWLDQKGGRAVPVHDKEWLDRKFPFFDENGKPVEMCARDVLSTEFQLGYRYEDDPPPARMTVPNATPVAPRYTDAANAVEVAASTEPRVVRLGLEPAVAKIELTPKAAEEIAAGVATGVDGAVQLTIDDIEHKKEPGVYFEVYLNLPDGVEPSYQEIFYVGNFSFIGLRPVAQKADVHGDKQPVHGDRTFPVGDLIQTLIERKAWDGKTATVTVVLRGLKPIPGLKEYDKPKIDARFRRAVLSRVPVETAKK